MGEGRDIMNRYNTIIISFWHRVKAYFKRFWYIITDKEYKETLLEAHREALAGDTHPYEFKTIDDE